MIRCSLLMRSVAWLMGVLSAVCPAQDTAEWFARTGAAGARITGAAALSFTALT